MILKNGKRIDGCSDTVPVGTLNPFLGLTPPAGYLICQGQRVSKQLYPELYAICGNTFGTATATEFYLPDLRGKTITGYKEGDTTFGVLGALIGDLTHIHGTGNHTLTESEIPSHSHTRGSMNITGNFGCYWKSAYEGWGSNNSFYTGSTTDSNTSACVDRFNTDKLIFDASRSWTGSTSSFGGDGAHNHGNTSSASSLQPSINLNWIVKAAMLIPVNSIVENNLTSTSTTNALSAAQGKILNDKLANFDIHSFGASGYQKLPGGLMIQWTRGTVNWTDATQKRVEVSFPTTFPNACLNVQVTPFDTGPGQDLMFFSTGAYQITTSSVNVLCKTTGSYYNIPVDFYVLAIGY